ncbi:hypothetical protein CPA58_29805, partial [Klebsiella pneumoniae]
MVNYTLQTNGLSNTSIHISRRSPTSSLASAVGAYMVNYTLQTNGLSNTSIHISRRSPTSSLASAVGA